MINCQNINFSPQLSRDRIARAQHLFGIRVLKRILCFALYLLGVKRSAIGQMLEVPTNTAKSILKALSRHGLPALEDRRRSTSTFLPPPDPQPQPVTLRSEDEYIVVDFGIPGRLLKICRNNALQVRTVLLSLLNSGLVSKQQVAVVLELTPVHLSNLARRLESDDVLSLADRRQGQQSDYRVTPDIKAELIQQFAADVIGRGHTSGAAISVQLQERCNISIPARTVRFHLAGLGLRSIKHSLPQLVATIKKTSGASCCP